MRMIIIAATLGMLMACSPEKKMEKAESERNEAAREGNEKIAEEQRDVDKAATKGNEKVAEEQADVNKAAREAQEKMNKADAKAGEAIAEMEEDRGKAAKDLADKLQHQQEKINKMRQDAPKDDPGALSRLDRNLAVVDTLIKDTQSRIGAVNSAEATMWKSSRDQAKRALDLVDKAIDEAEKYKNPDAPAPTITPLAEPVR